VRAGHHLDLAARATVKSAVWFAVATLNSSTTADRNGTTAEGGLAEAGTVIGACSSSGVRTKARDISVVVSAHVIGGIAPVKLEVFWSVAEPPTLPLMFWPG